MTAEKTKILPLPPIVGGVDAFAGGIVLLVMKSKKGKGEIKHSCLQEVTK